MILRFENFSIRNFSDDDLESILKYANNINVSRYLRDSFPFPYTRQNAMDWIEFIKQNSSNLNFAIADENEVIGGIGVLPSEDVHRYCAEIGFWLGEPFWNKGIMTKAVKVFCTHLFNVHHYIKLTANVFEGNEASKKVLQKTGFILEGTIRKNVFKNNKFLDQYIYGLLKEDFIA